MGNIEFEKPKEEPKMPIAHYASRVMEQMPIFTANGDVYSGAYVLPSDVYEMAEQQKELEEVEIEEEVIEEVVEEVCEEPIYVEEYVEPYVEQHVSYGDHLTAWGGVYWFGNQKETWYNLDMSYVVYLAQQNGLVGEYWVREDGCKMFGDYIILACNRDIHPYGSLVETSLGWGISLDTGGFAVNNPYQVDVAVDW